jgi:hypothetical protein
MYVDALLALSGSISGNTVTGQALFASGATVLSTNTVDLGVARDIGEGQELFARIEVTAAFTGGTSVEFQVIAADAANLTGNVAVIGTTGAIPVASLVIGARFACAINPRLAKQGQRYLGLQAVNVGANAAGSAYADIGLEVADFKTYPVGFSVL